MQRVYHYTVSTHSTATVRSEQFLEKTNLLTKQRIFPGLQWLLVRAVNKPSRSFTVPGEGRLLTLVQLA